MIKPKNETENFLLSITKNCGTLIEQIHRKAEETMEFKMTKQEELFHFNPPIEVKDDWMIGLKFLQVYNSVFNLTKKTTNSNFINFLMKRVVVFHTQRQRRD